jgi:hypothetical protein
MKTFELNRPDVTKIIYGLPTDGQKIKFIKPSKWGFITSTIEDQKFLKIGEEYTVNKTQFNSSSTRVWLEEVECYDTERGLPFYNLGSFEWDLPEIDLDRLIGVGLRECFSLYHHRKIGIKIDDDIVYHGTPMLILDYDRSSGNVTKAYYE